MSLPIAILAGGKATRLYPLTETIPKSLVDVAGKPFILHQMELLQRNGVSRIVICAGFLGEKIQETLRDGSHLGLRIDYVFDGPTLLGTGGALKRALPALEDSFFVLYGDSFLDIDYRQVENEFRRSAKLGLMTVYKNLGQWDRSNVRFKDGEIIEYDKRSISPKMLHIDYGLGVLRKQAFDGFPADEAFDLADVYGKLVAADQLAGFEVQKRFYEIGSPQGLEETRSYIAGSKD